MEELEEPRDLAAARAAEARVDSGESEYLPIEMVGRLATEHPLRVWREYRGLTGQALAKAAGVSQNYIGEIELGRRRGSVGILRKLARARSGA